MYPSTERPPKMERKVDKQNQNSIMMEAFAQSWPAQARMLGEERLRGLTEKIGALGSNAPASQEPSRIDPGQRMDLMAAIEVATAGLAFLKAAFDVVVAAREAKRTLTASEADAEVAERVRGDIVSRIPEPRRLTAIRRLLDLL